MDLAVFECLNVIPNEYYRVLVRDKSMVERAGRVFSVIWASQMRGSDPRVSRTYLVGYGNV